VESPVIIATRIPKRFRPDFVFHGQRAKQAVLRNNGVDRLSSPTRPR